MTEEAPASHNPFARALESAAVIEESLGVGKGFLIGLSKEDDWSFVLKTHAVIEAALEQVIIEKCFSERAGWKPRDEAKIKKLSSALPMDGRVGKLGIAVAYGVLADSDEKYVRTLTEVRNRYAHRPSNISKSIRDLLGRGPDGRGKLRNLVLVDINKENQEVPDVAVRALCALTAASVLWSIQFNTKPPQSLLSNYAEKLLQIGKMAKVKGADSDAVLAGLGGGER